MIFKPATSQIRRFSICARFLPLLLLVFTVAHASVASAQAIGPETFAYTGKQFLSSGCGNSPCAAGSITAGATVVPNGLGGVTVVEYSASGPGVSLNLSDNCPGQGGASMSVNASGQVYGYYFSLTRPCTIANPHQWLQSYTGGGYQDFAAKTDSNGNWVSYGATTASGSWTNSRQLGHPASPPQVADATPKDPTLRPKYPDGCCGDPIDIASGNMFEQVTDYTTTGPNPLRFVRYYNSKAGPLADAQTMGMNWRHNFNRSLRVISASAVVAERPDGRQVGFALVGSTWTPDTDVDIKLTNSGSTWTLTDHDDTIETYTVSGSTGTLNTITLPNGYTQTLNYTSGVLTSVSDSYSRSLTFTYTSGLLTGVSTPDSATLTFGYTATAGSNVLTSITYNTSPTTSQTYLYENTSYPFALTGITDENGHRYATWSYDTSGRATSSKLGDTLAANYTQVSYDDVTGNRTVTGPLGIADTYKFTGIQGVPRISEIDRAANGTVAAATRLFTYDSNGYLASAQDWNGNTTQYTNNSHGDPTSITEAYGTGRARTTTVIYDTTWIHRPYTVTRTNQTVDYRYDATTGNLLTKTLTDTTGGSTNGQTHVWTYTYNSTGQMLTEQFPRTGTTVKNTYTYTGGALTSITDQLSHATTINTYNGSGQPTKITDPNSVVTNLTYDNRNRLLTKSVVASPSNELTTYTYIGSGQPDIITMPDSSTVNFDYDNAQRVTKITNTAGETMNYTLDALGDITTFSIKESGGTVRKSWTATYDALGNRLTVVGAGGVSQTTNYAYDGNQNRKSTTDANSKQWQQAWDELDRASTITDPLTHTAAPTYNNLDYVTAQTDFNGYSTSYTRDAFSNAIARSSPDAGSWSFTFDEDNNLTAITDARSVATVRTFDAVDRLTGVSITGYTGENEAFTYDDVTAGNKGVGRLTGWTDESGSTARTYDNFGNITKEVRVISGKTYTTTYSYDLANRLKEIIYPSGRFVDYTYDTSGYLTKVTTKPTSGGTVTTLANTVTHKPFGPLASFVYGNSETQTRTYDNNYWLSTLNTVNGTTYRQKLSFGYDNAGNLTSITDNLDTTRNQTLTVDDLNRLHTASGKYGSRTYTYDNNSNRATRVAGATTYTYTNVTSKNQLDHYTDGTSTRNFTYTANGNVATDDRTFVGGGAVVNTFGGRDRLESQTVNSQPVTFKINALGQRVSKTFSSTITHYIHDIKGNIIAEANGSTGAKTMEYVWMEGMLLAQINSSGTIFYVHSDQVNNPQKITNASRTIVWDRIPEPFGETFSTPTNTTPTNHRFPGQYADAENSLSYNNARDYDSSIGRYGEADPIGFIGGPNVYGYALQNPTEWIDFLGLRPLTESEKRYLAPYIPSTSLNTADLRVGEPMPWYAPKWATAITRGNRIYFSNPHQAFNTPEDLGLLGHELVHVGQYANGMNVADYLWSVRRDYYDSKYEIAAIWIEERIIRDLTTQFGKSCP